MTTQPTTSKPVPKLITLHEWDEATNQQRTLWLEGGYLLSHSDGEALSGRNKARSEAYRAAQQLDLPCGTIQPPEWMLGELSEEGV